ncbi:MAG: hypothetical protein HOP29_04200 [Phycisphaerales bacterium]|nr:hypothetical protein [Phycisphaerales bacterium]
MIRVKPLLAFLAKFLAVLVVLVLPWPGFARVYPAVYHEACNFVYGSFGPGRVTFGPFSDPKLPGDDTKVTIANLRTGSGAAFTRNSRVQGYMPTVFVVALALATPFAWRRRLITLGVGFVGVTGYVVFRQFFFLMFYARQGPSKLFDPGPTLIKVLEFGRWVFVDSFTGLFVVPAVIWVAVSFRRRDWERFMGGSPPIANSPPRRPSRESTGSRN